MGKQNVKNTKTTKQKKVIKKVAPEEELKELLNPTYTNIYYFKVINSIGGIETFFYQLAQKYKDKDLTIFYETCDQAQLKRLQKYVRCIKYTGQKIKCKRAFFNFNINIIDNVEAEEYILVLHGDYKDMIKKGQLTIEQCPNHHKINRIIGVSQQACEGYKNISHKECELCYNPYIKENTKPILKLISTTRLTKEKGFDRMKRLSKRLEEKQIPYLWLIFTDSNKVIYSDNVIMKEPTLNIIPYLQSADYLVQLSDNEGYCYSVVEALSHNIPVIVTPCPVFKEIGLNKNNSITMDFDCSNIDEVIDKMINDTFNFTYTPKEDNWDELLGNNKSFYQEALKYDYIIEATGRYKNNHIMDAELQRIPEPGESWSVDFNRLLLLTSAAKNGIPFIKYKGKKLKSKYIKKEEVNNDEKDTSKNN